MAIAIRQLHKHFVGEVSGIDLRKPLTKDEAAEIEAGMDKYAVLVFHGQDITDDQQMDFALNFGERENPRGGNVTKKEDLRLDSGLNDVSNLGKGNWPPQIFMMGWNDLPNQVYDPTTISSAQIDGNFDYLTNQVNWASADASHTLPASLFVTQPPAFFSDGSGYTWPPVDPLGTTAQFYTLPAYARYQAGTPFAQP